MLIILPIYKNHPYHLLIHSLLGWVRKRRRVKHPKIMDYPYRIFGSSRNRWWCCSLWWREYLHLDRNKVGQKDRWTGRILWRSTKDEDGEFREQNGFHNFLRSVVVVSGLCYSFQFTLIGQLKFMFFFRWCGMYFYNVVMFFFVKILNLC